MDSLRGNFDAPDFTDISDDYDIGEDDNASDLPPAAIGQDERRMQVRAYNHWASMLGERSFPSIEELDPHNLPDFGPYSVLLDFSTGIENPAIQYLGDQLAAECGTDGHIAQLSDVPSRSLLSRITDHYLQILANQAPIGFEAEFVNQRGSTILYRGILLPFSSDNDTIDFIYGVINWKEVADQSQADELLLEIDQALEAEEDQPSDRDHDAVTDWADGPSADSDLGSFAARPERDDTANVSDIGDFSGSFDDDAAEDEDDMPEPAFGDYALDDDYDEDEEGEGEANYDFASLTDHIAAPTKKALSLDLDIHAHFDAHGEYADDADEESEIEFSAELPEDAGLYDYLAVAREAAQNASENEDRSRKALYQAVGQAYDFSLAAQESPEDYDELLTECGLSAQERAPMTPVVKLVFGADYDKTRLTEYATVLTHAHRVGINQGELAEYIDRTEGGIKGVVSAERRWRKEQAGKDVEPSNQVRRALAEKLRKLEPQDFADIASEGGEFALVMIRRTEEGEIVMLGEIEQDIPLIERAARKLLS